MAPRRTTPRLTNSRLRDRKFLGDRAIELPCAEGTNAASFNEISKKEAVK